MTVKYAKILSTGSYLPKNSVTNDDLAEKLETSHDWIFSRTGIASRHIANEQETTNFMAYMAASQALQRAEIEADELDLIIVATCTPDNFFPSTACFVAHNLHVKKSIPAFDLSAACSGFVYALDLAKQYIENGTYKNIMVIGSEKMSAVVDWQDRSTCVLFGDGAGAAIITLSDKPGIEFSKMHALYDNDGILSCSNDEANNKINMQGNQVFKVAVNRMGEVVDELLAISGYDKNQIDWLIPHQANIRIMQGIAKKLDLPFSRVIVTVETQGNTSAASIPIALDHAITKNKVKRGDLLLLEAFGGGMTWGALLIRY